MPTRKRKPQYESSSDSSSESDQSDEEQIVKKKQPAKKVKTSKKEESDTESSESENEVAEQEETVIDPAELEERVRVLQKGKIKEGGLIIYWMSRDQRSSDNWALLYAQELARKHKANVAVVFTLADKYKEANSRQFIFMLKGLQELESTLSQNYNIPFVLLDKESAVDQITSFIKDNSVHALVCDFSPLKPSRSTKDQVIANLSIPVYEVDTHNIIPVWTTSEKQEFAARTIRNKIHKQLPRFLTEIPALEKQSKNPLPKNQIDWDNVFAEAAKKLDKAPEISWIKPGEKAAQKFVHDFFEKKLKTYDSKRNDPTEDGQSNISPYFHFGQISPQRVALLAGKYKKFKGYASFIEEMVVRRELSDNFCFYNSDYDNTDGFPDWAQKSLKQHAKDKREHLFSFEELDKGTTYDNLWNAAQHQLIYHGKLHGYMRMYWAKKILEWTKSPKEALSFAIALNDKYEMDGNDPNGYVGCAWSIGGVHDRPWKERSVFGKIRYMNYEGCKRKFDVQAYITKYLKKVK